MKKTALLLIAFAGTFMTACNKDDAATEGIDLSNTVPPYVELSSTATKTAVQGTQVNVGFQMRQGLQQKVTVYYDVTGAVSLANQTVVFDREKLTATAAVAIPAGIVTPPATSATATLKLTKAVTESGTQLTLGSKNDPASQVVNITITP